MAGSRTDSDGVTGGGDRARAYQLFAEALDREGELREQFLTRECGADFKFRAEVDALLLIATRDTAVTGSLLGSSGRTEDLAGQTYGHFRLTTRIGEGGMGVVYRADRTDGVQQSVAIKLISTTVGHAGQVRFEREAQLLAQIEHPAVARLGGCRCGERPSLDCHGIRQRTAHRRLLPRQGLELHRNRQIAGAAGRGGSRRASHVGGPQRHQARQCAGDGRGSSEADRLWHSRALQEAGAVLPGGPATVGVGRLFSPGFAAPEQINGGPVTVATDVFGLGALAYRLLTGRSTFPDAVEPLDYMLAISQRDVELPSRAAQKAGRAIEARQLRGDLDAILCKALERGPERRYVSAIDMQEDLQSYLTRRPVKARVPTLFYRSGKFVRRNTLAVSLVALLVVGLLVGAIFVQMQRHRAEQARDVAARRAEFIENLLASVDPTSDKPNVTVAALLDSAAQELDQKLGGEPLVEASILGMIANTDGAMARYPEALAASDHQLNILRAHGASALELGRALATRGSLLRELASGPTHCRRCNRPWHCCGRWTRPRIYAVQWTRSALCLRTPIKRRRARRFIRKKLPLRWLAMRSCAQRMNPLFGLSVLLGNLGRYQDGAEYGRQASAAARETLPADNPAVLNIETSYANSLTTLHRTAEAEPLLRHVIAAQTKVLGPDHKHTLLTRLALVADLEDQHRDEEAAAAGLPGARSLEALLGADNLYAMSAWNFYGSAACSSHQEEQGLVALERVAAARQRLYPPGTWVISSSQLGIGVCLFHMGQYAKSEATLLAAVSGLENSARPGFQSNSGRLSRAARNPVHRDGQGR